MKRNDAHAIIPSDSVQLCLEDGIKRISNHIPAPKMKLPGKNDIAKN